MRKRIISFLNKFLQKVNYKLCKIEESQIINNNSIYQQINPYATYSPWHEDNYFNEIYNKIRNHTLIDKFRLYELWTIARQIDNMEGVIIEIGVWKGGSASILANAAQNSKIYLADTFCGVCKSGEMDLYYKGGEHNDTSEKIVYNLLHETVRNYKDRIKILKGVFPDETGDLISKDERIKLIHIDVDVYKSARDIILWLENKLTDDAFVIFDDYGFETCNGITKYVNELNKDNWFLIYNINGHAILTKKK